MKKLGLLLVLVFIFSFEVMPQIVGWEPSGLTGYGPSPWTVTSSDPNLTVGGLTRGSGVTLAGTAAANAWGGTGFNYTSATLAIAANAFATFTLQVNPGYLLSLSTFDLDYRRSAQGPNQGLLQYRINSGSYIDIGTISFSSTAATGNSITQINLSSISALQNLNNGSVVTIRIVPFNAGQATGTWYIYNVTSPVGSNLRIGGTVTLIPTINTSLTTLPDFDYLEGSGPSFAASYNLSGAGLIPAAGNLTVTGTSHYYVGLDSLTLSPSISVPYTGGTLASRPIYVRLIAGLPQGDYSGELISNAGGNATTVNVTCNGEVGAPVPVELTSFSASSIGKNIKLSWNTATEVNNYGFEIERSVVKSEWNKIGFVNGNGNSNSPKNYSFVDDKVSSGKYSYRLKQIDNDGQFEYSKTIEIDVNGVKKFELAQNYPNPFNPTTTIQFQLPQTGWVKLTLYNILGQEIKTLVNEVKEAGTHTVNFDASELNSGVYIYRIESGSYTRTQKMTLIK